MYFAVLHRGGDPPVPQQDRELSRAGAVLRLQWKTETEPIATLHLPVR